jgi:hypothetical protein
MSRAPKIVKATGTDISLTLISLILTIPSGRAILTDLADVVKLWDE